ncbi:3D domain-containing protein [Bacillus sp. Marseille-P3800]|uniref:3D domain-containing protein n=1 Tax=Bacillus sp. Marseille-P3800 TaxID=2014782 RepID=UPI000C073E4B|nr:3D domain-containing protein [Bacillus sp. Marseille-P3800]
MQKTNKLVGFKVAFSFAVLITGMQTYWNIGLYNENSQLDDEIATKKIALDQASDELLINLEKLEEVESNLAESRKANDKLEENVEEFSIQLDEKEEIIKSLEQELNKSQAEVEKAQSANFIKNKERGNESSASQQESTSKDSEEKSEEIVEKKEDTTEKEESTVVSSNNALAMEATYYTARCEGCSGITFDGTDVRNTIYKDGKRVVATDPSVIRTGSVVRVVNSDGSSFEAIAADIGGAIKGNKIDILVETKDEARRLGRVPVDVEVLN